MKTKINFKLSRKEAYWLVFGLVVIATALFLLFYINSFIADQEKISRQINENEQLTASQKKNENRKNYQRKEISREDILKVLPIKVNLGERDNVYKIFQDTYNFKEAGEINLYSMYWVSNKSLEENKNYYLNVFKKNGWESQGKFMLAGQNSIYSLTSRLEKDGQVERIRLIISQIKNKNQSKVMLNYTVTPG